MTMVYRRQTTGDMDAIGRRLEEAVKAHKFGILGVIDLQAKMKEKGVDFKNPCRIYEVCNPRIAKQVLEREMTVSTALPCRISLYQEADQVTLATLRPTQILGLFDAPDLATVAQAVEKDILAMVDEAAGPSA
jgi:uncharacterized protein (DUF302 family)